MNSMPTFFRRLLPVLLLSSLALASCGRKECDPRPKKKCGTPTSSTTKPGGNS